MSSIVGGMNAERTNKWLLIGAAVLAVVAGALVFAALANFGSDDEKSDGGNTVAGDNKVLVANQDIAAGATMDESMFDVAEFDAKYLVVDPVTSGAAVDGKVARVEILKGQQMTQAYVGQGTTAEDIAEQLALLLDRGQRGVGVSTDAVKISGGHVIPGDRVDIVWSVVQKESPEAKDELHRTEMIFQNVEVVARTDKPVEGVVTIDETTGAPKDLMPDEETLARRNNDVEPGDDADYIVLALTPEEVLRLLSAADLGELTFTLRPYGDNEIKQVPPIIERVFD